MRVRAAEELTWFCRKFIIQRTLLDKCKIFRDDKINRIKKRLRKARMLREQVKESIRADLEQAKQKIVEMNPKKKPKLKDLIKNVKKMEES